MTDQWISNKLCGDGTAEVRGADVIAAWNQQHNKDLAVTMTDGIEERDANTITIERVNQ